MIRLVRWFIVLFFAVTTVFFTLYTIKDARETDAVPPVISCDSDTLEASVNVDEATLLEGMTAEDDRDGDVTDSLVVVSKSKLIEKGKLRVNYAAFDSHSNVATYSRVLTYTDYVSPKFSLSGPLRYSADTWSYSPLDKISAEDCIDGDISSLIKYKYGDDSYYGVTGKLGITFQVTNSAGDTVQLPVSVEVLSQEEYALPYPELTDYLVYTKQDEKLDPEAYLKGVLDGSHEYLFQDSEENPYDVENVTIDDQVNYAQAGVYEIVYTLNTQDGWNAPLVKQGSTTLYVVVEE